MNNNKIIPGIVLIVVGLFLLANNLGLVILDISKLWPLFLLIPGLLFEFSYFVRRRDVGVLVPGGILTVYGCLFFVNILTNWNAMDRLWPFFIFGPAVGLFQLYLFGGREKGVLIASGILGAISMIMLSFTMYGFASNYIAPVALILFGLMIMFKGNKNKEEL